MEEVGLKFTRTFHITMKKIKVEYRQKLEVELKDFLQKVKLICIIVCRILFLESLHISLEI